MEITSIRMNKDETEIGFIEARETQTITSTLVDAMTPAPEFQNAFKRLQTLANEILNGLLKSEALKKIKVTKVNFKKNEAGAVGCIISLSAEIETSNRPFHFNTPLKFALAEGQEESEFYLSGKSVDLLHELQKLAADFMNGVRAQQSLALEEKTESAPNEKPSKLPKNRKTCYNCNKASSMVIEGVGYCKEHGKAKLVTE